MNEFTNQLKKKHTAKEHTHNKKKEGGGIAFLETARDLLLQHETEVMGAAGRCDSTTSTVVGIILSLLLFKGSNHSFSFLNQCIVRYGLRQGEKKTFVLFFSFLLCTIASEDRNGPAVAVFAANRGTHKNRRRRTRRAGGGSVRLVAHVEGAERRWGRGRQGSVRRGGRRGGTGVVPHAQYLSTVGVVRSRAGRYDRRRGSRSHRHRGSGSRGLARVVLTLHVVVVLHKGSEVR